MSVLLWLPCVSAGEKNTYAWGLQRHVKCTTQQHMWWVQLHDHTGCIGKHAWGCPALASMCGMRGWRCYILGNAYLMATQLMSALDMGCLDDIHRCMRVWGPV